MHTISTPFSQPAVATDISAQTIGAKGRELKHWRYSGAGIAQARECPNLIVNTREREMRAITSSSWPIYAAHLTEPSTHASFENPMDWDRIPWSPSHREDAWMRRRSGHRKMHKNLYVCVRSSDSTYSSAFSPVYLCCTFSADRRIWGQSCFVCRRHECDRSYSYAYGPCTTMRERHLQE